VRVRPIFLHNDDRVEALVSVVGLALLVFGLIESELRRRLATSGCRALAGGSLRAPQRAATILAAFQGLGA
jgi:transposase